MRFLEREPIITNECGRDIKIGCGNCKHWKSLVSNSNRCSTCKRIDGRKVKFYKPWFLEVPDPNHIPCRDFEPLKSNKTLCKNWVDFDTYFDKYLYYWRPVKNYETATIKFEIMGYDSQRFFVKLKDFVEGNLWRPDGKFNVTGRISYKSGFSSKFEELDGIEIS